MKLKILLVILICSFLLFPIGSAENLKGLTLNWEPFYGENLPNQGPISEISVEAFKLVGYDLKISFLPWERCLDETQKGKADVLLGCWYNKDRESFIAFSDPLASNELGLYKMKSFKINYTKLADLKKPDITIGTVAGYVNPAEFDAAGLNTEESISDLTNLKKLVAGRIQLVLVDKLLGFYQVKSDSSIANKANQLEWVVTISKNDLMNGIALNSGKDWKKILADFNRGLAMLKKNGNFDKIMKKHGLQ